MGQTKSEKFSAEQNQLASFAKALGHPARIAILQYLIKQNSCVCGDIVEELPLSQSTVSQHLKELKTVGLIKGIIEGPSICYCIDVDVWDTVKYNISLLFNSLTVENNCC